MVEWKTWDGRRCGVLLIAAVCIFSRLPSNTVAQETQGFQAVREADRVDLRIGGELITSYHFRSGSKPVLWPLIGPDGAVLTRHYPIEDFPNEEHDHIHHRGLWMTFGNVNGIDFWAEGPGKGEVIHKQILELASTSSETSLLVEHDWIGPDASAPLLKGLCRFTLSGSTDEPRIDCEYLLKAADKNATITFGDTKEGMFAIRVPEPMRAELPKSLQGNVRPGQILNDSGEVGADTWGKSSAWVDYTGSIKPNSDATYGIAILIHPQSFRSRGLWHVRTYGLFAHNPIGANDFLGHRTAPKNGENSAPYPGGLELAAGDSIQMCYRVILHRDRWAAETVNERYKQFAGTSLRLAK